MTKVNLNFLATGPIEKPKNCASIPKVYRMSLEGEFRVTLHQLN